jgi:hypothetical protein
VAELSDSDRLAACLRPIDKEEVRITWGSDYAEGIRDSISASTLCWTVESVEGDILMIFGVGPSHLQPGYGIPWMLASIHLKGYTKELLKESRWYVNLMNQAYPYLFNLTHPENTASIRWLKWCGFEFKHKAVPVGDGSISFLPFQRQLYV